MPALHRYVRIELLLIIGALYLTHSISAQSVPKSKTLTVEDGLGFRDVTAIEQDGQGLMWLGTRQGLNRYDGYRFIRFGDEPYVDHYLPCENILLDGLELINENTLWVIGDNNLYSINTTTLEYTDITEACGIRGDVWQVRKSRDGSIWIVWDDEELQYLCRSEGDMDFSVIAAEKYERREFTSLAIDTADNAWWSTVVGGLKQYNARGELLHTAKLDSFNWQGTIMHYTPLYVDSRNHLFVFPKGKTEIWIYHPEQREVEVIRDSLPSVGYHMMEDKLGNMWFSSKTGLFRWNTDRSWTDFAQLLDNALQFSNIQGMHEDQTNLMWVATDNGLVLFPNQKQLFETHFTMKGVAWGNAMRAIFDDHDGNIYSFCERGTIGVHRVDPLREGSEAHFLPWMDERTEYLLGEARHFISNHAANTVWTINGNLIEIDLSSMSPRTSIPVDDISEKFSHNPLIRLHDGSFLIGSTLEHLSLYNPLTKEFKALIKEHKTEFSTIDTKYFLERPDHSLWIATASDGLYLISRAGEILQHLSMETQPALSNDHLLALCSEGDSILWIGTFGGGINQLDITRNSVQVFTQNHGLPNNNVTGILIDDNGNVWASTYNGLSCYLRKESVFQNFYEEEGLPNNEFNYSSSFKDRTGKLWFGGMNGVITFNPKEILEERVNPPLVFTGFSKYNRLDDSLTYHLLGPDDMSPLLISPYDSYFQLTWMLPNYFKTDKNRYYVWLEGLENSWNYIGNLPTIRYHTLPPGRYTLHIKGADSKGNWSATELSLPINVRPFFYKTWWFITLSVVVLGSLIYALVRYRLQRLMEMERMRTRIASDLHDEVGSMLSGVAMQAEILEMQSSAADQTKLHRLSEISRGTVSKMRDVVWSIDSRRDKVKDLVDRMRESAEELLLPNDISLNFELGELPLDKKLVVDVRQHLFLFFKEALTNIVRHSDASEVYIRFGHFDDHFELSVHDNGTGSSVSSSSTGLGLQNMELRAKKLGGVFSVDREGGFKVMLRMRTL